MAENNILLFLFPLAHVLPNQVWKLEAADFKVLFPVFPGQCGCLKCILNIQISLMVEEKIQELNFVSTARYCFLDANIFSTVFRN